MSGDLSVIARGVAAEFAVEEQRDDPVAWADSRGVFLWSAQRALLAAVPSERRVAAPAGHGVGKSFTAATLMAWAGATSSGDDTVIVTTAPTGPQLENVWRPFKTLHRKLGLRGRVTGGSVPMWKIDGTVVATGRTTRDTDAHSLSGGHGSRMTLVIVDEADGVAAAVWEQISGMMSSEGSKVFALGNPRNPASQWKRMVDAGGWRVLPISMLASPNLTGERVPRELRDALPSQSAIDEKKRDYGVGSTLWKSRVEGVWPEEGEQQVLAEPLVRSAVRYADGRAADVHQHMDDQPLYAVDVARGVGADRTVIGRVLEREFSIVSASNESRGPETRQKVAALLDAHPGARAVIDCDGIGGILFDELVAAGYRGRVEEFHGSHAPVAPVARARFVNKRAESMWHLIDVFRSQLVRIDPAGEHVEQLVQELVAPAFFEDKTGRIVIEKKDDIKRRLGKSPDFADTFMMACAAFRVKERFRGSSPIVRARGRRGHRQPRPGSREAVMGSARREPWKTRPL